MSDPVASPCVKVCKVKTIGPVTLCLGCYRKIKDIAAWSHLTNDEKKEALRTAMFLDWMLNADKQELL